MMKGNDEDCQHSCQHEYLKVMIEAEALVELAVRPCSQVGAVGVKDKGWQES